MNLDTVESMDKTIGKQFGQDVIDSFSVLEAVVPTFDAALWPKFTELFPMIILALRSQFAIIRQSAARCFATMCDVMTVDAMRCVVETVIPFIGDSLTLSNRQGAVELVYRKYYTQFKARQLHSRPLQTSCRSLISRRYPTSSSWLSPSWAA